MKIFRKKEDARKYLEELITKKWFQEKNNPIVEKLLSDPNVTAERLKNSAEYWKYAEILRRNLKMSLD